jgi:hypothetical protein
MKAFLPFVEDLKTLPLVGESDDPSPAWINDFLPVLDSAALYCFVALLRPRLYVEVGSGNSTKFVRRAIERHKLPTKIVSIDPHPRAAVDALCDKVIRQPLEEVNLEIFSELREGDILFIDHSHRALMNSDATVVFLDILPQLAPGVLVQIHDIFLPSDYPAEWSERYYSEQYLLACYLLSNAPPFEIVLPAAFISGDADLRGVLDPLWKLPHMRQLGVPHGGSFWVRMLAARSATDTE